MNIQEVLQDKKKLAILGGMILLVAIVIILLFSSSSNTGTQTTTGGVRQVVLAKGETTDKKPITPTNLFSANDPAIYAFVSLNNIPPKSSILYQWYDLDNKKTIKDDPRGTADTPFTGISITSIIKDPRDRKAPNWGVGNYEFRVFLNGQMVVQKHYEVKTDRQISEGQVRASIKDIQLTTSVNLQGIPTGNIGNLFSKDDPNIYASVVYENLLQRVTLEGRWIYLNDGRLISKYQKSFSGTGSFAFNINARNDSWIPTKKWPVGKYRLEVYLDTEQMEKIDFEIK